MRLVIRTRLIIRRPLKESVKLLLACIPPLFKEQLLILHHQRCHLMPCHPCLFSIKVDVLHVVHGGVEYLEELL